MSLVCDADDDAKNLDTYNVYTCKFYTVNDAVQWIDGLQKILDQQKKANGTI
jgi:hypothetical protein